MPNPVDKQVTHRRGSTLYSSAHSQIQHDRTNGVVNVVAGEDWNEEWQSQLSLLASQLTLYPTTPTVHITVISLASLQQLSCVLCRFHPSVRISTVRYQDLERGVTYEAHMEDPCEWSSVFDLPLDLFTPLKPNDQEPWRENEAQILAFLGLPISRLVVRDSKFTTTPPPQAIDGLVSLIKSRSTRGLHIPSPHFTFTTTTPGIKRPAEPISTLTLPSALECQDLVRLLNEALDNPWLASLTIHPAPSSALPSSARTVAITKAIRSVFESFRDQDGTVHFPRYSLELPESFMVPNAPPPPRVVPKNKLTALRLPADYISPSLLRAIATKFPRLNMLGFITTLTEDQDEASHRKRARETWSTLSIYLHETDGVIFPRMRDLRVGCSRTVCAVERRRRASRVECEICDDRELMVALWNRQASIWFPILSF